MRTTLTISDELDARLRKIAREQNRSYKEIVNEVIRHGLDRLEVAEPRPEYHVRTRDYEFQPGIDRQKLNLLFDEIEGNQ
jgi:hypothetical protein